jgi:dihydroorotate dehydrogenase
LADLLVLNVSSPNTPGLRDMQTVDSLTRLVDTVRAELETISRSVPLLVKIAPDLANDEIDAIAHAALRLGIDGIVAVNTTTSREALTVSVDASTPGGVSGPPLRARALEVLRRLHAATNGEVVLVSVGGLETAADAMERIRAGATLVQAYTGFVYGGPAWPSRINRGLIAELRATGACAIGDVVGSERASDDGPAHHAGDAALGCAEAGAPAPPPA